jgi:hypothetical protein
MKKYQSCDNIYNYCTICLIFVTEFTGIKSYIISTIHIIEYLIKYLYQIQLELFNKVNYRITPTRCKASEVV